MSEQLWLLSLIKEGMLAKQPIGEDEKIANTVKPKSKIQQVFKDFFETLKNAESPDAFDKFYEENLKDYSQSNRFTHFLDSLGKKVDLEFNYPYFETEIQKALFELTEKRLEESEVIDIALEMINEKYPNLVAKVTIEATSGKVREQYSDYVDTEIEKIKARLERGESGGYEDKIQQIERAKKTEVEHLATELNKIVIFGRETWELIIYSILSPFAPNININNLPTRPNLHFLTVGDVSTAKSKLDRIVEMIAPKSLRISKSTEANFEGVAKKDNIGKGIIDYANNGVLIIPEFTRIFEEFQILREVMDCDKVTIFKGGMRKPVDINITFFAGCNPKKDFFQNDVNLREQIAFKDGVLTRLDILLPLMATKEKNEFLLDRIDIFGTKKPKITLEEIHERLLTLSNGMVNLVTNVSLTPSQKKKVKQAFRSHNSTLKNRPLLVLRDLDTLCRLVNVITATNFHNRERKEFSYKADNSDIDKAIELWEEIIIHRKTLYTTKRRIVISLKQRVMAEIIESEKPLTQMEVKERLVSRSFCSARTIERKIKALLQEGRIVRIGERNGILKVAS